MLALLEELDNPHLGRVTVHIAGSKGKGSVAAMVASMLRAAGVRTGLFTSPHLHRFPERIQIDGEPVSTEEFAAGLAQVKAAVETRAGEAPAGPPARHLRRADGARLPALPRARGRRRRSSKSASAACSTRPTSSRRRTCAVITNIGLEHREILGDTIAEIARQKAGIIVAGCPTVMAPQRESAADVIREVAAERGSPLTEVALVCNLRRDSVGRRRADRSACARRPAATRPSCRCSASTSSTTPRRRSSRSRALAAAGVKVAEEAVKAGLESVKWPARIEIVKRRPLVVVDVGPHGRLGAAPARHRWPSTCASTRRRWSSASWATRTSRGWRWRSSRSRAGSSPRGPTTRAPWTAEAVATRVPRPGHRDDRGSRQLPRRHRCGAAASRRRQTRLLSSVRSPWPAKRGPTSSAWSATRRSRLG